MVLAQLVLVVGASPKIFGIEIQLLSLFHIETKNRKAKSLPFLSASCSFLCVVEGYQSRNMAKHDLARTKNRLRSCVLHLPVQFGDSTAVLSWFPNCRHQSFWPIFTY